MSIGGALAEARSNAGLSVSEVSERTRIREKIIREIERDDYAGCGGDFYARGHIRAIAKVVGTDSEPLIAEYDAALIPPDELGAQAEPDRDNREDARPARATGSPARSAGTNPRPSGLAGEPWQPDSLAATTPSPVGGELAAAEPAGGRSDRLAGTAWTTAARIIESCQLALSRLADVVGRAEASRRHSGPGPAADSRAGRRLARRPAVLAVVVIAVLVIVLYLLLSGSSGTGRPGGRPHHPAVAGRQHAGSVRQQPAAAAAATPAGKPSEAGQPDPAQPLIPASVTAFGAAGAGQGDAPQLASLATDRPPHTAWHTSWYATARFGGLRTGTGLLLNMGRPVTVTSARILLGPASGTDLQLRAGAAPALASLRPVAAAAGVGGTVTIRVATPLRAQYLLLWLTRLPPDGAGMYQAFVYDIAVQGSQ